jgi:hypothetical protein
MTLARDFLNFTDVVFKGEAVLVHRVLASLCISQHVMSDVVHLWAKAIQQPTSQKQHAPAPTNGLRRMCWLTGAHKAIPATKVEMHVLLANKTGVCVCVCVLDNMRQ